MRHNHCGVLRSNARSHLAGSKTDRNANKTRHCKDGFCGRPGPAGPRYHFIAAASFSVFAESAFLLRLRVYLFLLGEKGPSADV